MFSFCLSHRCHAHTYINIQYTQQAMACVLILCLREADWKEHDAGRSRLTTAGRHETEPVDHSWLGTHTHQCTVRRRHCCCAHTYPLTAASSTQSVRPKHIHIYMCGATVCILTYLVVSVSHILNIPTKNKDCTK